MSKSNFSCSVKTVPHSAKCINDKMEKKKFFFQNNLRTIEARIVTKLRNNEPRPKLTGVCSFENIGGGGGG